MWDAETLENVARKGERDKKSNNNKKDCRVQCTVQFSSSQSIEANDIACPYSTDVRFFFLQCRAPNEHELSWR